MDNVLSLQLFQVETPSIVGCFSIHSCDSSVSSKSSTPKEIEEAS